MAEWTAEVFQNEYLPADASDVHAIVSVSCAGAGTAGASGQAAEVVIIDCSGSMATPGSKMRAARHAAQVAIDEIVDGTLFAVIAGTDMANLVYPDPRSGQPMAVMSAEHRAAAKAGVAALPADGGTAIGSWITLATQLFRSVSAAQRHAILLTDGRNESEDPSVLRAAVAGARDLFQCDCRGVGTDWAVEELRFVATELLGSVDLVADPEDLEADFEAMMKTAMARGVADAHLHVWAPKGAQVLFVRQVAPTIEDLTARRTPVSELIGAYPLGSWGDETREYHVAVQLPAKQIGSEQLAARVQLHAGGQQVAQGLVKAIWSDDDALTTRINPAVAHYTGQTELAAAIQDGLAARAAGDDDTATTKLGRALELAKQTGNDEATDRLLRVVEPDADGGTVRLRRDVSRLDEMALDTRSTKTTRVR